MAENLNELLKNYKPDSHVVVAGRKINIPVCYNSAEVVMVFFLAPLDKIIKTLDNNLFQPVKFFNNKGIVAVTLFNYHDCDIGPFEEFTFSIPVVFREKITPPILPLIFNNMYKSFGFYVVKLGANSDLARDHIEHIFPYPSYKKNIQVKIDDNVKTISASILENNNSIITIEKGNIKPLSYKTKNKKFNTYYKKNGETFNVILDTCIYTSHQSLNINNNIRVKLNNEHCLVDYLKSINIEDKPLGMTHYKEVTEIASLPKKI